MLTATGRSPSLGACCGTPLAGGRGNDTHSPCSPRKGTGKGTGKAGAKAEASSQTPFKPASPMKHSAAPQAGDFYGTLSKTSHTVVCSTVGLGRLMSMLIYGCA